MFDGSLPEVADLSALSDAALVEAAGGWARAENAAGARKLAVMAEIFTRRTASDAGERALWWIDPDAAVAAELAAALNVSQGMALHQTHRGVALRDRLPAVAALFEAGLISDWLIRTIVWRTYLITDEAAMTAVDAALAKRVTRWGALSVAKTEAAIDALVDEHDPGALRRSQTAAAEQTVQFGSPSDVAGMTSIYIRLNSPDAALMEQTVDEVARSVCDADPRSTDVRRAHAIAAKVNGTAFECACKDPDCTGGTSGDAPAKNTVVYVVADEESVDAAATAPAAGESAPLDAAPSEPAATDPQSAPSQPAQCHAPPAFVFGAGIMPTALLAGILQRAQIRQLPPPGADPPAEPRYAPSRATADFVRCRDLTCRFPGCDKPAQVCDLDHTVAYPVGPTHPSNLKCLCRFHHLLKTFWNGATGWRDRQLPDGTVVWTSPTGHTYVTYPGSQHLFPQLCQPTATLWAGEPPVVESTGERGAMMPKRRQTRAHNKAKAIAAARKFNDTYAAERITERNKPPPF